LNARETNPATAYSPLSPLLPPHIPQQPDDHPPRRLVLLQVDQQLAELSSLGVPPELADPVGAVEVREREDVAEFGAGSRTEDVEALAKPALKLVGAHEGER
jgi:hypothetical protein